MFAMSETAPHSGLPSFPVDDITLNLVEQAVQSYLSMDEADGGSPETPVRLGADGQPAEFGLYDLLDFLSGTTQPGGPDETYRVNSSGERMTPEEIARDDAVGADQFWIDERPHYCIHDVISALIAEVRRLRGES